MTDYTIRPSLEDVASALQVAANVAAAEGFPMVAERERDLALHLLNARNWALANTPPGYRLQFSMSFSFVPDVNPVLREDLQHLYRERSKAS